MLTSQPISKHVQSNHKIRRSVSVLSEQHSKRSSMSILNIQDVSVVNSHQQQQEPSFNVPNFRITDQYDVLSDELLPHLKNRLVESYRVVKKHYKDQKNAKSEYIKISREELGLVYRGMSNGLKMLETVIEEVYKLKMDLARKQAQVNQLNSTANLVHPQPEQHHQNNPLQQTNNTELLARIHVLENQLQQQKEKHNQEIRLMIQNHEQEMMFVEQQQSAKLNNIKKDHQQQLETILQAHKKRQEQIRNQTMRKVNEMVRIKVENMKGQELTKSEQIIKENQEKEDKYKCLIKKLTEKLTQSRTLNESLSKQLQKNLLRTKSLIHKLTKPPEHKSDTYLKLLSQKINSLLAQEVGTNDQNKQIQKKEPYPNAPPMPYSTMAIEQMFMKSDESVLDGQNNFEASLEGLIEQLVWWGFFWEDNEDNVNSLFNIARHKQTEDVLNPANVLSHTLYPLILQKIKLTLTQLQPHPMPQLKDSLNPIPHPTTITQFSTEHLPKLPTQYFPVRYRNIQSIEQLEVSDSMICDENEEKEKRIGVEGGFQNHSPIVNYKGYGTMEGEEGEASQSFDVELF